MTTPKSNRERAEELLRSLGNDNGLHCAEPAHIEIVTQALDQKDAEAKERVEGVVRAVEKEEPPLSFFQGNCKKCQAIEKRGLARGLSKCKKPCAYHRGLFTMAKIKVDAARSAAAKEGGEGLTPAPGSR